MHLGIRLDYRFSAYWDDGPPPSGSISRRWKKRQLSGEIRRTAAAHIDEQLHADEVGVDRYSHRPRANRAARASAWGYWGSKYRRPHYGKLPADHPGAELLRLWASRA